MFRRIIPIIVASLATLTLFASRPLQSFPNWTLHTAFDNEPRKIFETADYVYFFVNQLPFNNSDNAMNAAYADYAYLYDSLAAGIFVKDKNNPDAGPVDLQQICRLSGTDMRFFEVDPATNTLAIAYCDGGVDIVTPDRKVIYIDRLKKRNFPGASLIMGVAFDPVQPCVRICAESGYIEISTQTYAVTRNASWEKTVTDINSVGDNMVAIIDGKICVAPSTSNLIRNNSFEEIELTGATVNGTPLRVMPLSDSHFAVATDAGSVYLLANADGTWQATQWVNADTNLLKGVKKFMVNRLEGTVVPAPFGWVLSTAAKVYILKRGEGDNAPTMTESGIPPGLTRYAASYDLSSFWFYKDRGLFIKVPFVNVNSWAAQTEEVRANAPLYIRDTTFAYSSTQGLVSTSADTPFSAREMNNRVPPLLTTYKDGVWRNVSSVYNLPYRADTDEAFKTNITANNTIFPLANARGLTVDPVFPDKVYMGAPWTSSAICDIADPRNMPLIAAFTSRWASAYAKWQIEPWGSNNGWGNADLTCFSVDADNNIWKMQCRSWAYSDTDLVYFSYLTPAQRQTLFEDETADVQWNVIEARRLAGNSPNYSQVMAALKHPKNRGRIVSTDDNYRGLWIYDTKNTLEDTSDDTQAIFKFVTTENGTRSQFTFAHKILEDPVDGKVYILGSANSFIVDLDEPVVDETIKGSYIQVVDGNGDGVLLSAPLGAYDGCFDEYGRMWLATRECGVYCLDMRQKKMLAHYEVANSPLPSNDVRGVIWNPDTKTLFISTTLGIAEVRPEPASMNVSGNITAPETYLLPANVEHGYTGTVSVRNVPESACLHVTDADGRQVTLLPSPVNGFTHWDLVDADGKRVAPGLYIVKDATSSGAVMPMYLTVQ